jgi:hypothetical protein
MRSVIRAELESCLQYLKSYSDQQVVDVASLLYFIRSIVKIQREYKNLPIDVRIRIFRIETINVVEKAYNGLAMMAEYLEASINDKPEHADPCLIGLTTLTRKFEDAYNSVLKESGLTE